MAKDQTVAIGLHCKSCSVPANIHHVYLHEGKMYMQGPCERCQEQIRFAADDLLISLMRANPKQHPETQG